MLGVVTVFGERGIVHIWRLTEDKRKLDEANFLLQQENEALRTKIHRLRHDDLYLEKVAREELGLARPGEIVYRFAREGTRAVMEAYPERLQSSAQKGRP
jgi:cell division protein FtsB